MWKLVEASGLGRMPPDGRAPRVEVGDDGHAVAGGLAVAVLPDDVIGHLRSARRWS